MDVLPDETRLQGSLSIYTHEFFLVNLAPMYQTTFLHKWNVGHAACKPCKHKVFYFIRIDRKRLITL